MAINYTNNDVTEETQWRSIILFGKNSATYKFAFAKCLLEQIEQEKTTIKISDLVESFSHHTIEHLKKNDKQGNSRSSTYLDACRDYMKGKITKDDLYRITDKHAFNNVVDAFQNVNGDLIKKPFYEKDYGKGKREIILTDELLKLKLSKQKDNLLHETEARWNLVETAWNLSINPNLLQVNYEIDTEQFFIINESNKRIDVTSARNALNGYQKGKCFYSFNDISVLSGISTTCHVDHFIPHTLKTKGVIPNHSDLNNVWNLVLSHPDVNLSKSARIPERKYLERLHRRNEFFIESKHPLHETIINQTGRTTSERIRFLNNHYTIALDYLHHTWKPTFELEATF